MMMMMMMIIIIIIFIFIFSLQSSWLLFLLWIHYTVHLFHCVLHCSERDVTVIYFLHMFDVETQEGVSKTFRTGRLERELQMLQLSATKCSCIAILWVSIVSFAAITLCVASQRVFIIVIVYFIMTESGNFWIHRRTWHNEPTNIHTAVANMGQYITVSHTLSYVRIFLRQGSILP
jgi:hypothetical protein